MPETHKGPTPAAGEQLRPQDTQSNRTPGGDQQQPQPNENLQNQPFSSDKTMDRSGQQQHWNDQTGQEGISAGVTEGHTDPQQAAHGRSAEAGSKSSTGLPQPEDRRNPSSDYNPRTQGGDQPETSDAQSQDGGGNVTAAGSRGGLDHNWERNAGVDTDDEDLGNQPDRNELAGASQRQQGTLDPYQADQGGAATPADTGRG